MKVLHLVDSFGIGGSECLAANLAEGFMRKGVDNVVCALGSSGELVSRLQDGHIPYINLGANAGVRPSAMFRIGGLIHREGCDFVITHHFRQLLHAAPAACILRRPIIHVEHDFHSYMQRPDIVKKMGYCMPAVKTFVGVSEEITAWFQDAVQVGSGKFQTIRNGVEVGKFTASKIARQHIRALLNIPDKAIVVGTCARMEPVKDLELLIRGFREMVLKLAGFPSESVVARLVCVGDGSMQESFKELASSLGVLEQCVFPGMVDNVEEYLASFDIYSITSKDEGLPLSVMEAMSTQLPVVATDVGSVAMLVDSTVGRLLDSREPAELGAALAFLAKEKDVRRECGKVAREKIKAMYSMQETVDAYLNILEK